MQDLTGISGNILARMGKISMSQWKRLKRDRSLDIFQLLNSNFPEILKCIFLKMQMWTGYIALPLIERKKCSLKLNVKWQSMISLIDSMKKDPGITVKEPAVKTGLTEDGVRYHMNKMRRAGILVREGSTKAGKWIVKEL